MRDESQANKGNGADDPAFSEVVLSVLGYQEEGEWVALSLEMDLRGYGKTFNEAFISLTELIEIQFSFAVSKNQPELIFKPAEPVYWTIYERGRAERLESLVRNSEGNDDVVVGGLEIPPAHVIASLQSEYQQADG